MYYSFDHIARASRLLINARGQHIARQIAAKDRADAAKVTHYGNLAERALVRFADMFGMPRDTAFDLYCAALDRVPITGFDNTELEIEALEDVLYDYLCNEGLFDLSDDPDFLAWVREQEAQEVATCAP
jgi:hypothetical protein